MDIRQTTSRFVVQGTDAVAPAQGSRYQPGISAETVGSCGLSLAAVTPQLGQRIKAHIQQHESGHCMLSGEEVELWTGHRLDRRSVARPAGVRGALAPGTRS